MSDLKFADSHNMVAFLEKPTECEGFEQIVDFQNAPTIKYALTVNPTIYASCIEQFWDTIKVKTVNEEVQIQSLVDRKKVIIIEASVRRDLQLKDAEWIECLPNDSIFEQLALTRFVQVFLDKQVEVMSKHKGIYVTPSHTKKVFANMKRQGKDFSGRVTPIFPTMMPSGSTDDVADENVTNTSNNPPQSGEDRLKLNELMELCTNLSQRVLDLENTKTSQAANITELKERVKKLENKRGSRNHKLKRLYKVGRSARVVSSEDEGLGDQEDASKQGRKINDIDQDAKVTLVDETRGRYGQSEVEKEVSAADPVTTAGEVVTTASVEVSTTILTETTTVDELTLAQTLIEIKSAKPKVKKVIVQEPVQSTTTTAPSTIPKAKSITFREPGESTTRTTPTPIPSNIKNKGKAKMIEPEKPLKEKEQIRLDEELALKQQAKEKEEDRLARERLNKIKMQTLLNKIMFKL
ncbi:hypothetical protein Tco_1274719 [Tanacetum coccineum]